MSLDQREGASAASGPERADTQPAGQVSFLDQVLWKQFGEAETALSLAMRLDSQDPQAVLTLAAGHYAAERYKAALPLLELGISLCRNVVETPGSATASQAKTRGRHQDLTGLLKRSMEMYEVCLERVDPFVA